MEEARHRRIAADLRARIQAGEWPPGSQIPSRRTLAADYGVHHETVRLAIDLLRAEAILEGRPKRRLRVAGEKAPRTLIDPDASWPYERGDAVSGYEAASEDVAMRLEARPGERLKYRREELLDPDGRPAMLVTSWRRGAQRAHVSCRYTVKTHAMTRPEADLLGLAVGTPALLVERTRLDGEGRPVEVADLVLPADRWEVGL